MDRPLTKRLTRKDIRQPDLFMDFMGQSARFLAQKKKLVAGIVAGILVILAACWGLNLYQQREKCQAGTPPSGPQPRGVGGISEGGPSLGGISRS
jgi:hypothetical protein